MSGGGEVGGGKRGEEASMASVDAQGLTITCRPSLAVTIHANTDHIMHDKPSKDNALRTVYLTFM